MKEITLTQGQVALVDDEDYEELSKRKWYAILVKNTGKYYAVAMARDEYGNRIRLRMHCVIMNQKHVDHWDGDGLHNQRCNLRPCTQLENTRNAGKTNKPTTSQYKGVYRRGNKYRAQITVNYQKITLGTFDHEADAARRYDSAAVEHFGQFARLNFPA